MSDERKQLPYINMRSVLAAVGYVGATLWNTHLSFFSGRRRCIKKYPASGKHSGVLHIFYCPRFMTLLLSGRYFCTHSWAVRAAHRDFSLYKSARCKEANDNLAAAHGQWREYSFCVYTVNYDLGARRLSSGNKEFARRKAGFMLPLRKERLVLSTALK
jgi:hypothetical protein